MRLGVRIGEACARIHDDKMRNLNCLNIEVDEVWGFIGKKRCNLREFEQMNFGYGEWTYVAIDRDAKLVPAFMTSSVRSVQATHAFINKRFQQKAREFLCCCCPEFRLLAIA
jgi:hypothetical protein